MTVNLSRSVCKRTAVPNFIAGRHLHLVSCASYTGAIEVNRFKLIVEYRKTYRTPQPFVVLHTLAALLHKGIPFELVVYRFGSYGYDGERGIDFRLLRECHQRRCADEFL